MNIDITKTYTTRSGLSVRIYATDGAGMAVHGAYKTEAGWEYAGWTEDGSFYEYGETNDLGGRGRKGNSRKYVWCAGRMGEAWAQSFPAKGTFLIYFVSTSTFTKTALKPRAE
jgi:hypothetical protein